jgi:hypothetical protein
MLALIAMLLVAGRALAMSSDHYRLDWFTPLTGAGGGSSNSTSYAVNLTVGQTASGTSASTTYDTCLGYWCMAFEHRVFLPVILRNHS